MNNKPEGTLSMIITSEVEQMLKDFPFFLEIEMLEGDRKIIADGRIEYKIEIHDINKIEVFREFMLKFISNSHKACKS